MFIDHPVFPLGHFVVAAVPAVSYLGWQDRRLPGLTALFVVEFGDQFPYLLDKPLAHRFFLLPANGRLGAHSLRVTLPIAVVALYIAWRLDRRRAGLMFLFVYGTHLVADYYRVLLSPT